MTWTAQYAWRTPRGRQHAWQMIRSVPVAHRRRPTHLLTCRRKATITLTLANNGMEAFMPEKYPGAIVIERWIDKNGSSGYKFRATEDGKILSTKRDELVQICSHFNIEIDSPLTLLTQDNAKTFLASTDDRKLYEVRGAPCSSSLILTTAQFFFRGTSLQQLADNYTAVDQQQRRIQKDLETASESIPDQQTKVDRLQKEIAAAQKARDLKTRKVECEQKLAWAYVTRKEHVSDQQLARAEQQDIEAQRQEVTTLEKKVVLCQERIDEKLVGLGYNHYLPDTDRLSGRGGANRGQASLTQ